MQTVDSFKNRLEKALMIRNVKPVELHEKTGLSESLISKYLSGNAIARQRKIDLIAEALNINPVWLLGYDVPMDKTSDHISNQLKNIGAMYISNTNLVKIPILGTVKAGYNYLAEENWIGTIDVDKKLAESGDLFALKVHGDSMSPTLIEDDIVIIKKQDNFENGDIVVAIINGDEATIKKGKKSEAGILLQPLNSNYEPLIFTYDEMKTIPVTIVGIVKQLKREF